MADLAAKVLVVDDLEDNRNVLSRHLVRMGCDVTLANNGREALESLQKHDHEIVLLDIMMPEVDGFEVIEKVRADVEHKQPSIIAVSARHDTDAITKALNMGANDYVTKPYDFPVVWARVEKQLNQARSTTLIRDVNTRLVKRLTEMREKTDHNPGDEKATAENIIANALSSANRGDLKSKLNHEVRTRLHQILGLTSQLKSFDIEKAGPEEAAAQVRHIEKNGRGLLAIVEDLADFLTLQQGLPSPADIDVNLRDAVLHEWEMLDGRQDTTAAKFNLSTDNPKQTVTGSPYYIRKAIAAILSNAVRFTEHSPAVDVKLTRFNEEFYKISIADNGIGIPEEHLKDVIAPFYQVESGLNRKYEGLGLGLPIANNIMTLHRGKLNLVSTANRQGAVAELYFPYQQG